MQEALRRVLEAVFEPMFYEEMMGFRPNRNCHMALRKLNHMLEKEYTNYVLDADIKGFFDHLDHGWIIKFVESRIKDPNIIRLVRVMLKAGIMKDYTFEETEEGSGQGSVCSPVIANMRLSPLACIQNVVQVGRYSYMLRKMIGASLPGDMTTKLYEHTSASSFGKP